MGYPSVISSARDQPSICPASITGISIVVSVTDSVSWRDDPRSETTVRSSSNAGAMSQLCGIAAQTRRSRAVNCA